MNNETQKLSTHTETWQSLMDVISKAVSIDSEVKLPLVLTSLPELPEYEIDGPPLSFIHGPSGRNISLAIGLRAALPDTPMLLIMNADAVTLGMNHLIHAARRNMGMTLLILRSEITDTVEMSPVKRTQWLLDGIQGDIERRATPLDLATSLGAASVSRGSLDDIEQLAGLVSDAMKTPGFSMVGVTAEKSLPLGLLSTTQLPEYFESYKAWSESLRNAVNEVKSKGVEESIETSETKDLNQFVPRFEMLIAGIGGQGIKLSGSVLNEAAGKFEGLWTSQRGEYGSATRGGPSMVEVVTGSERIGYPHADNPNVLVLLNNKSMKQFASSINTNGHIIVDADQVETIPLGAVAVPIIKISIEHTGKPIAAGVVSLGCIAAVSDVISIESLKKSISLKLPAKLVEKNIEALVAGYEATCRILKGENNG